jgi:hypothetical protein
MSRFQNASTDGLACALMNGPMLSYVKLVNAAKYKNCLSPNFYKGTFFFLEKLSSGNRLKRAEIESKLNLEMV